jgi:hypothetical protein
MAQYNFTPPPTPANTSAFDDIGTTPHPMVRQRAIFLSQEIKE